METHENTTKVVDARKFPAQERHMRIFEEFMSLNPGNVLEVIAPHEPEHLLQHMSHEGLPVDMNAYYSRSNMDGTHSGFFTRLKSEPERNSVKITSFEKEKSFSEEKFNPIGIYTARNYKVIITYIKAGQFIPVHSPHTDLIFAVFSGTGIGIFGDKEEHLSPGSVVIVPGGEKRGIKAITDIEGLHIATPIPDENDHTEVRQGLANKRFQ